MKEFTWALLIDNDEQIKEVISLVDQAPNNVCFTNYPISILYITKQVDGDRNLYFLCVGCDSNDRGEMTEFLIKNYSNSVSEYLEPYPQDDKSVFVWRCSEKDSVPKVEWDK